LPGIHIYRLSEIDQDGIKQELETKAIQLITKNDFTIFPNPTNSGSPTYVVFSPKKNLTSHMEVVSAIGTVIEKRLLDNTVSAHELQLTKGQYFVRIVEDGVIIGTKSVVIL
jgi:hypothetical protein